MLNREARTVFGHHLWRSRRLFAGYVGAGAAAVATLFSSTALLLHPGLHAVLARDVSSILGQLLIAGQLGVALFALFFILFFHRYLLRLRTREFGLLRVLGLRSQHLRTLVGVESGVLAACALTMGAALGMGVSWVLFSAVSWTLGISSLPFLVSGPALALNGGFFVVVFAADAVVSARMVGAVTPKVLLSAARLGQGMPRASRRTLGAGSVCLMVGYAFALGFQEAGAGVQTAVLLTSALLVGTGTYGLFRGLVVWIMDRLRRRTRSGLTLLLAARLAHRAADLAWVLTTLSLLGAGVVALPSMALGVLSHVRQLAASPELYETMRQAASVALFVLVFLSGLLFIAVLSTLASKLFTQLNEDRLQFAALRRLGLAEVDLRRMVFAELSLLVSVSVITAVVHGSVAMGVFTTKVAPDGISNVDAWWAFARVGLVFAGCMAAMVMVAHRMYIRSLWPNRSGH